MTQLFNLLSLVYFDYFLQLGVFSNGLANLLYVEEMNAQKKKIIEIMFQEIYTISSYI